MSSGVGTRGTRRRARPDAADTALDLRGSLDSVEPDGRVFGWCWSPEQPAVRRAVTILMDGRAVIGAIADVLRADLLAAGIGDGGHGLVAEIPQSLRKPGAEVAIQLLDASSRRPIGAELAVTWAATAETLAPLDGNVDLITRDGWVSGWCWEPRAPRRRLLLDVLLDEQVAGTVEASEGRPDLRHAAVGDGRYGFNFMLPYDMLADRGAVRVRVAEHGTGRTLGEPAVLRMGRRAEQDTRLAELERQVTLMGRRLEQVAREQDHQPEAEVQAARQLFATVAGFFQDLADGLPAAALAAGPRGGIAPALAELRRALPELALRGASPGADGRPVATVAVPANLPVEQVHACLAALRAADTDLVADIVLLDPAATDPRCALLPALVANLRVGAAGGSEAASFARLLREADTRLVALVSPQVQPQPGWLGALVATFDDSPEAGLVGGVVIRPDGLLRHAGFLLDEGQRFRDLGHLAQAELPEHRFLRPVDAVGPWLLLVDRGRANAALGLDPDYAELGPAIADLCLALRSAGCPVLRQPAATAFWTDRSTPDGGTGLPERMAASEDGRRLRLSVLRHARDARADPCFIGHALVVDAELPRPDRDAGSVVALEQMQVLRRLGWRVTFAAAGGAPARAADRQPLERAGIEVIDTASVTDTLRDRGGELQLVHLYRHRIATLLLPRVRELAPRARILFSPADLHFLRESREAALAGGDEAAAATRAQEIACARAADATILLSDHERDLLAAEIDPDRLHLLRWIARPATDVPRFDGRVGLLFIGHFRHAPNVDAALWYAREVLPILRRTRPGLVLDLIGADAPPAVAALDGADIRVRGWVADLAPLLARTRLTVAPLRYGAGFKGKVATSLAAGVPVVGTPIAFEGTGLAEGDGIAQAATAEAIADAIVRVHDEAATWEPLSARARERVAALYSPDAADAMFRRLLGRLGLPARP